MLDAPRTHEMDRAHEVWNRAAIVVRAMDRRRDYPGEGLSIRATHRDRGLPILIENRHQVADFDSRLHMNEVVPRCNDVRARSTENASCSQIWQDLIQLIRFAQILHPYS